MITVHTRDMDVAEENTSQKLKRIDWPPSTEDVVAKDVVQKNSLALEEDHIDS